MDTKQLKAKILDLAIHGKLLPLETLAGLKNSPDYEPASKLLEKLRAEKEEKIAKGELKRDKKDSYIFIGDDNRHYEKFADGSVKDIEDEIPFELPEGWAWCCGAEVFNPMKSKKPSGETFEYIDIEAIDNKKHRVIKPKIIKVSEAPSRASREVSNGDVLFSLVRPYLENIALINEEHQDCIASTGFYVCKPNKALYPNYLFLLMTSDYVVQGLNQFMKGDNSPSINGDDIVKWFYPVPPLTEQKRIVAEIEKIFNLIDSIETDKSALQLSVKQAKAKILDLAIHGKLVPQDPADEPAAALLEKLRAEKEAKIAKGELKRDKNDSYIYKSTTDNCHYEKFSGKEAVCIEDEIPFEVPEGWAWCRLGEICELKGGKRIPAGLSATKEKTEHIYIRVTDMQNNSISDTNLVYITDDIFEKIQRYTISKDDLYLTIAGTIGRVGEVPDKFNGMNLTENALKLTNISICKKYLMQLLNTKFIQDYFESTYHQVAMPKLSLTNASKTMLPLPPISEQKRIVSKIEELFKALDKIRSNLV